MIDKNKYPLILLVVILLDRLCKTITSIFFVLFKNILFLNIKLILKK